MDRLIDGIELIAAVVGGVVAINIFLALVLRRFFDTSIPDSYDFGRLMLGVLIFWGIAAASYRGSHITVDVLWSAVGPRFKRLIDIFATLVLLFVVVVHTLMLLDKVLVPIATTSSPTTSTCRPGRCSRWPGWATSRPCC